MPSSSRTDNHWPPNSSLSNASRLAARSADRERPLFFAQQEAIETAIFLTEVAGKEFGGTYLQDKLRGWAEEYNPGVLRTAFKMATGTGKTTVMGMLIAWHTLNKAARPQDRPLSERAAAGY